MYFDLANHGPKSGAKGTEFAQCLFKNSRKRQETECMSSRGGIEDNHGIFHGFNVP